MQQNLRRKAGAAIPSKPKVISYYLLNWYWAYSTGGKPNLKV